MNVYISKANKNYFLEKLKEISIIDDYILDRERLGKEKIKLVTEANSNDTIKELISILPVESMIVDQTEYPGKEYLLCIGEVAFENFNFLYEMNVHFSIVTIKENVIRFNAWVHFSNLLELHESKKVDNFSSINGKIEDTTFFIFEGTEDHVNIIYDEISKYSSEFIIKENKIYVKLLLQDFCKVYENTKETYNRIDIIDEESL